MPVVGSQLQRARLGESGRSPSQANRIWPSREALPLRHEVSALHLIEDHL